MELALALGVLALFGDAEKFMHYPEPEPEPDQQLLLQIDAPFTDYEEVK